MSDKNGSVIVENLMAFFKKSPTQQFNIVTMSYRLEVDRAFVAGALYALAFAGRLELKEDGVQKLFSLAKR